MAPAVPCTCPGKRHRLGTAAGVIGNAHRGRAAAAGRGRKGDADRAIGSCRHRAAAMCCSPQSHPAFVPVTRTLVMLNGSIAAVRQGDRLSRTGRRPSRSQTKGWPVKGWPPTPCPSRKGYRLGAATGIVGNADRGRAAAAGRGREGDADRAVPSYRHRTAASVGLGKVTGIGARDRKLVMVNVALPRVRQGDRLSRAGRADRLAPKRKAGR